LLKQYLSPTFFLLPLAYYHQVGAQLVGGDIDMVAMTGSSAVGKKVDSLT
jgi:acyl-CoA reductase-like NAD-dependent aldehyde dehydrogenase